MIKGLTKKFSIFEMILISLLATLGIATKPIITPLAHIITGPLYIPGGAIAGGLYMMWIVLGAGIIQRKGTASLVSIVQAIMVVSLGIHGSHGIMSFVTYIAPGIMVDLYILVFKLEDLASGDYFVAGILANITGTFLVNIVLFRLPLVPLVLTLAVASFSGGLGGLVAYGMVKKLRQNKVIDSLIARDNLSK